MEIKEFIENYNVSIFHRKSLAIFKDKNGNLEFVIIISDSSSNDEMYVYNEFCNRVAEVKTNNYRTKNFYLYNLYVEKDYRNLKIATYLIELIEHRMKKLNQTNIIGVFEPFEFTTNRTGEIQNEEIITRGRNFYLKNNFELITFEEYLKNREKYSLLYPSEFGIKKDEIIIYKQIKEFKNNFNEINEVLVHNNVLENIDVIDDFINPKRLKLSK